MLRRATNVPPNYQLCVECREALAQRGRDTARGGVEEGGSLLNLPGPLTLGPAQGLGIEGSQRNERAARKSLQILFWPPSPRRQHIAKCQDRLGREGWKGNIHWGGLTKASLGMGKSSVAAWPSSTGPIYPTTSFCVFPPALARTGPFPILAPDHCKPNPLVSS